MNLFKFGKKAAAMKALPHADRYWLWQQTIAYAREQLRLQERLVQEGDPDAHGRATVIKHGIGILEALDMSR